MRNTYSVYDNLTGKYLLEGVKKKTILEALGICRSSFDHAMNTGRPWKERYEVEENEADYDESLMLAWDTYMPKLRTAGKNRYRPKKKPHKPFAEDWDTYTAKIREVAADRLSQIRIGCGEESKATA